MSFPIIQNVSNCRLFLHIIFPLITGVIFRSRAPSFQERCGYRNHHCPSKVHYRHNCEHSYQQLHFPICIIEHKLSDLDILIILSQSPCLRHSLFSLANIYIHSTKSLILYHSQSRFSMYLFFSSISQVPSIFNKPFIALDVVWNTLLSAHLLRNQTSRA